MKFRTMDFSQDWGKLNDRFFATIRIHKGDLRFSPDERVEVISPKRKINARVLFAVDTKLRDIPMSFLEYDLEAKAGETRQDLYNKLGKRYKFSEQPRETDIVTLYFVERI
jgi:hypothetical protein